MAQRLFKIWPKWRISQNLATLMKNILYFEHCYFQTNLDVIKPKSLHLNHRTAIAHYQSL